MLDVHVRSQVRALSIVLVACDLFGTKFYNCDEIYDLINSCDRKVTRGVEISVEYLRESLKNDELKSALREILHGVIEFDIKKTGTSSSRVNTLITHNLIRYNLKHADILDKIVEFYEMKDEEIRNICSKEIRNICSNDN